MAKKVIIDCDPGIDDAFALALALFEPRLEVVAITAVEGNIKAEQASRNIQAILDQLDPPRLPRLGTATGLEAPPDVSGYAIHGADGLANNGFVVSQLHHQHPSEKIICDEVRAAPDEVTILCLGPLTNIARAFQRDPQLPTLVNRLVIMGGSLNCFGNVTPAAEYNIHYDPLAARAVFRARTAKTLIPLDVTKQVSFTLDFIEQLPPESCRIGSLLRKLIPFLFRVYHQQLGLEGILLHDVIALVAALHPELFEATEMAGDVETEGELTTGATVFDRRRNRSWTTNMEVATEVDATGVRDCIMRGLAQAAAASA